MRDTGIRFRYQNQEMHLYIGSYVNPRTAIALELRSPDPTFPGSPVTPYMTASVNVPDTKPDEVAIKDYAENEGILKVLIDNKIVSEPLRRVPSGYVVIPVCKLLV